LGKRRGPAIVPTVTTGKANAPSILISERADFIAPPCCRASSGRLLGSGLPSAVGITYSQLVKPLMIGRDRSSRTR
jgi:hypothetical protein